MNYDSHELHMQSSSGGVGEPPIQLLKDGHGPPRPRLTDQPQAPQAVVQPDTAVLTTQFEPAYFPQQFVTVDVPSSDPNVPSFIVAAAPPAPDPPMQHYVTNVNGISVVTTTPTPTPTPGPGIFGTNDSGNVTALKVMFAVGFWFPILLFIMMLYLPFAKSTAQKKWCYYAAAFFTLELAVTLVAIGVQPA